MNPLVVEQVCVRFPASSDWRGKPSSWIHAVKDVSFSIAPRETVGLVGESGCGKSTLGRAIVGLQSIASGRVRFNGQIVAEPGPGRHGHLGLQMVFQDPQGSLDPRWTAGEIIAESWDARGLRMNREERQRRIAQALSEVGLDSSATHRHPHEFSGGQRQRIAIARSLAAEPALLVCDEIVSALDVSVQAQVVNLLSEIQRQRGLSYLFISHDLAVVEHLCTRVLVMYLGRIVESGPAHVICGQPAHPYTRALVSAVPEPGRRLPPIALSGEISSPLNPPTGCPFHPRCPVAVARCRTELPSLRDCGDGHRVACHQAREEMAGDPPSRF